MPLMDHHIQGAEVNEKSSRELRKVGFATGALKVRLRSRALSALASLGNFDGPEPEWRRLAERKYRSFELAGLYF